MASIINNNSLIDYIESKFNLFADNIGSNNLTEEAIVKELNETRANLQNWLENNHTTALEKGQTLLYASQQLVKCSLADGESYRFYLQTIATLLDEQNIELVINENGSSTLYELTLSTKYRDNNAELLPKYLERIDNKEEIIFQPIVNPLNQAQTNDVITTCIKIENTAALTKLLPYVKTKANKDRCWQQLVASNQEELIANALKIDWLSQDDKNEYLLKEAEAGNYIVVKLLLDNGANIHNQGQLERTALIFAAKWGHTATARLLLEKGANIHHHDQYGHAVLIFAANWGHIETARLLLEKGANVDDHQGQQGYTALIDATARGHTTTAQLLLEKGANVNHQGQQGYTALICAAFNGRTETTQLLIDNGANIDHQTQDGSTSLMAAAIYGHTATVQLLLDNGADIAISNNAGKTALELAQGDCLKILQEHMENNLRTRPQLG